MGQHSAPEEPPPPKDKPRYRFLVAIGGIVALAFTAMAIVAAVFPEKSPAEAGPDATQVADPFPPLPTVDTAGPATSASLSPGATSAPASTPGPTATTTTTTTKTTSAPATPPRTTSNAVTATYARLPNRTWNDGFQATVTLTNVTSKPQNWQVTLVFANNVTPTNTAWIDGAEAPQVATEGHSATYTASTPIPPNETVTFFLQVAMSGPASAPLVCTVNGQTCSID